MNNKKVPTAIGTMLLVIIAITTGVFVWTYEKGQDWGTVTIQTSALRNEQKNLTVEVALTEPTSEWETCQNKKVGYEVRYPKDWKIYSVGPWGNIPDSCDTPHPELIISPKDQYHASEINFRITRLDTSPNLKYIYSGSQSLKEFLQKYPYGEILKEDMIDGRPAVWVKANNSTVLVYNNNTVFIISQKNVSSERFNNFLSTFKFL